MELLFWLTVGLIGFIMIGFIVLARIKRNMESKKKTTTKSAVWWIGATTVWGGTSIILIVWWFNRIF